MTSSTRKASATKPQTQAIKRVLAIAQGMAAQKLGKNPMAKRMKTSRSQLDRLLDADNDEVHSTPSGAPRPA